MTPSDVIDLMDWLGHDAFRINASKTIYFDPYQIEGGPTGDIILISHDHFDHCSPEDVEKIKSPDTMIVTDKKSAKQFKGNVAIVKPGDTITIAGVEIQVVNAYNLNKKFHPKKNEGLGFIVTIDGVRIYHAGDTDCIPEMKDIETDIALLPVSGTYVMTAREACEAALAINPKVAIPMHYGSVVGDEGDAQAFRDQLKGKIDVKILPKKA